MLVILIVALGIVGGLVAIGLQVVRGLVPWVSARSPRGRLFFYCFRGGPPTAAQVDRLGWAFDAACEALTECTTWTGEQVRDALVGAKVLVMPVDSWVEGGQQVSGLDGAGPAVTVGADFAALAHELGHQCEELIERRVNAGHVGWDALGIVKAEAQYAAWLASSS